MTLGSSSQPTCDSLIRERERIFAFYHQLQTIFVVRGADLARPSSVDLRMTQDRSGYDLARFIWVDKTSASAVNPL